MAFILSFLFCLVFVQESYQNEEKLRKGAILNQMRQWGLRTFKSGLYETGAVEKQFLVAAVISPNTFDDVTELELIEGCPIQPDMVNEQKFSNTSLICARSAVIFNRVDEQVWKNSKWRGDEAYKEHSWHGEYLFLHEGILQMLQENAYPDVACEIILYSYFIPCNYHSDKQPYRCSDLLSGYDSSKDTCKITTIGYTAAHPATARNLDRTLESLREKYEVIELVKKTNKKGDPNTVLVYNAIAKISQSSTETFQDVFYSCLRQSPIVYCIDPSVGDPLDIICLYYTHCITRYAVQYRISNTSDPHYTINCPKDCGRLSRTKAQKARMEHKFQLLLPASLEKFGKRCSSDDSRPRQSLFVNICAKKAFDMTDYFGKTEIEQLERPIWEKYDGDWVELYRNIPDVFFLDNCKTLGLSGTESESEFSSCTTEDLGPDSKRIKLERQRQRQREGGENERVGGKRERKLGSRA